MTFSKRDIEPLDFIIDQCLLKQVVTANDLIKEKYIARIKSNMFTVDLKYDPTDEFVRYLTILNEYDACECSFRADAEFARKNEKTLHFKKSGGFKKVFADLVSESKLTDKKSKLEIDNLTLQKENLEYQKSIREKESQIRNLTTDNLRLGNWDIRFRWLIAFITFLLGIFFKYFIDK